MQPAVHDRSVRSVWSGELYRTALQKSSQMPSDAVMLTCINLQLSLNDPRVVVIPLQDGCDESMAEPVARANEAELSFHGIPAFLTFPAPVVAVHLLKQVR